MYVDYVSFIIIKITKNYFYIIDEFVSYLEDVNIPFVKFHLDLFCVTNMPIGKHYGGNICCAVV